MSPGPSDGSPAQAQQGQGTAAPCPRDSRGCTGCSHRASPAPARPEETVRHRGAPRTGPGSGAGGAAGTQTLRGTPCFFSLPGSRSQPQAPAGHSSQGWRSFKDNTYPELLSVLPELGNIHVWDRKICFPHFLFMAQKKKSCKIQTRGQL